jgi:hypothetical protein
MNERDYVALRPLRFGRRVIEPGDPVPVERGRNYDSMLRLGQIALAQRKIDVRPAELRGPRARKAQTAE